MTERTHRFQLHKSVEITFQGFQGSAFLEWEEDVGAGSFEKSLGDFAKECCIGALLKRIEKGFFFFLLRGWERLADIIS